MKDKEKVRVSILEAAASLFDRFGYEKTSMEEIAKRARRAKASIYYHFEGKSDILRAVLESEFSHVSDRLEKIVEKYGDNPKYQLMSYLTMRMKLIRETRVYRHYLVAPYLNPDDEIGSVVSVLRSDFDNKEYAYFRKVCQDALASGILPDAVQPEAFGKMMVVLIRGLEMQFFYSEDYASLKSTYEALVEQLIFRSYEPFPGK